MKKWLLCCSLLLTYPTMSENKSQLTECSVNQLDRPNQQLVMMELQRLGVKHVTIVLAQSVLETGHYRSKLSRTHNNLFGFRTKKGYLRFTNWRESCAYYKKWQDRHYNASKHRTYYQFLRKVGYAGDPNYTTIVKKIANDITKRKQNKSIHRSNNR